MSKNPKFENISTEEILEELLEREKTSNKFHLTSESCTSYTFKFFKFQ